MSNQSQIALKVNDAYFTSEETAGWCRERLVEFGWVGEGKVILEPCVGSGQLVKGLPGRVIGCDLIDHGFPGVVVEDYLLSGERKVDCVFTNPPFGRMGSLALKVMSKAMGDSDRVAMILPASFRKISMVDKINRWFHPVYDEVCPNLMYELPNGEVRKVMTIFQMWERKDRRRVRVKDLLHYSQYMKRVNKEDAEYAFRTQGSSAGKVLKGLNYNPASTAFLRGSEDRLRSHDWTNIASFTAGIPAIGLMDVSYGLMLEDKGIDIGVYLRKGVTSTMM